MVSPALSRPAWSAVEALVKAMVLPGVGTVSLREAVARCGSPEAAVRALAAEAWPALPVAERHRLAGWARAALRTIRAEDVHVLTPTSPSYPTGLTHLHDPPYVLFARGRLDLLETPMVAVVGTRRCSAYGVGMARRIAAGIAASGATVLSGLATGIDAQAHTVAGPGRTVGVLGCGVDVVYPHANRRLQESMARDGLLLSELLPGTPPARHHFPRRNRMIAALAQGVVVVEAPVKSGALITARLALELGRPVFVVPGEVGKAEAAGGNALIRDGGTLVTSGREVLEALELPLPPPGVEEEVPPVELYGVGLALWRTLGHEPRHVDEVAAAVGLDPHQGLASLLSLEIMGHARQLPGLRFVRG